MILRAVIVALSLAAFILPTRAQETPNHYFGEFFNPDSGGDRRVSVLCIRGGSCRFEMKSMHVRLETHQCSMTTMVWDDISATESGRRFHTPPQRQGTHATSTFSFAIHGRELVSFREVYEIAHMAGREGTSQTFRYRPMSERDGGSVFDVSRCDELSMN